MLRIFLSKILNISPRKFQKCYGKEHATCGRDGGPLWWKGLIQIWFSKFQIFVGYVLVSKTKLFSKNKSKINLESTWTAFPHTHPEIGIQSVEFILESQLPVVVVNAPHTTQFVTCIPPKKISHSICQKPAESCKNIQLDYTRRARVVPKRLFMSGDPNHLKLMGDVFGCCISKLNPKPYQLLLFHKFADFWQIERNRKRTDGDTYGRTNIDIVALPTQKAPSGQ